MDTITMQEQMKRFGIEIEVLRQGRLLQTKKAWREMKDADNIKNLLRSYGWEISTQGAIWRAPIDNSPRKDIGFTATEEWIHNH